MASGSVPANLSQVLREFLFGTVVFVCVLLAAEEADKGEYKVAAIWGLLGLVGLFGTIVWAMKSKADHPPYSEGGAGNYAGRDNTGTQNVFHGPVTINNGGYRHDATVSLPSVSAHAEVGALTPSVSPPKPPTPVYIPMAEAAQRLLEESLGNLLGEVAMNEKTPGERLQYMANWIAGTKKVPVYGKRPPSTKYELISEKDLGRGYLDGPDRLCSKTSDGRSYEDLAVREDEFSEKWPTLLYPNAS